ncbi:uncharacterized protein EDB93DRAFT_1094369, partial [Suillus bovinus]|uniref:uncharacterized protein n=1 Tax=Suillus bovinus TaxID=48563 RepID=UPI001B885F6F
SYATPSCNPGTSFACMVNYGDESFLNFFHRLMFSPDGSLLLMPAGQFEDPSIITNKPKIEETPTHGCKSKLVITTSETNPSSALSVFICSRANFTCPPIAQLPGHKKASSSCQVLPCVPSKSSTLVIAPPNTGSMFALPYRMLYAVLTMDAIAIYDTQQSGPVCMLTKLHYNEFTDALWSPDGQCLILSSRDGYCMIAIFDKILPAHHTQQHTLQLQFTVQHNFVTLTYTMTPSSSSVPLTTIATPTVPAKRNELPLMPATNIDDNAPVGRSAPDSTMTYTAQVESGKVAEQLLRTGPPPRFTAVQAVEELLQGSLCHTGPPPRFAAVQAVKELLQGHLCHAHPLDRPQKDLRIGC